MHAPKSNFHIFFQSSRFYNESLKYKIHVFNVSSSHKMMCSLFCYTQAAKNFKNTNRCAKIFGKHLLVFSFFFFLLLKRERESSELDFIFHAFSFINFHSEIMKPSVWAKTIISGANYSCPISFFALLLHVLHALYASFDVLRPFFVALRLCSIVLRPVRKWRCKIIIHICLVSQCRFHLPISFAPLRFSYYFQRWYFQALHACFVLLPISIYNNRLILKCSLLFCIEF